jgi:hypothetical protein
MLGWKCVFAACLISLFAITVASFPAKADAFSDNFHDSCVKQAVSIMEKNGIQADAAFQEKTNSYCDCALTRIQGQFTASELLALDVPNPDPAVVERIKPIMLQCYKENFRQ